MIDDNSIQCAYPILETETGINFHPGLTKREHFAGLAPDNIPSWFHHEFADSSDESLTWHREGNSYQIGECGWTKEGEIALYFAWRTYYADALLKELAK
jgi:hypothetical protein